LFDGDRPVAVPAADRGRCSFDALPPDADAAGPIAVAVARSLAGPVACGPGPPTPQHRRPGHRGGGPVAHGPLPARTSRPRARPVSERLAERNPSGRFLVCLTGGGTAVDSSVGAAGKWRSLGRTMARSLARTAARSWARQVACPWTQQTARPRALTTRPCARPRARRRVGPWSRARACLWPRPAARPWARPRAWLAGALAGAAQGAVVGTADGTSAGMAVRTSAVAAGGASAGIANGTAVAAVLGVPPRVAPTRADRFQSQFGVNKTFLVPEGAYYLHDS